MRTQTIEAGAHVWLTLHARFIKPLLDLCLVLLGIPLVLSLGTRNIFVAAVIGILLAAVLVMVVLACDTLGKNYLLGATLAAWLPLLIFGPMAYTFARPLWD
jgi:lipopolysaccharide export system permease protein